MNSEYWTRCLRWAFWVAGLLCGAVLCYTTRFYLNGDAIAYVEMGEALRYGWLMGLGNLTYSPGYGVLLGIGQMLLHTDPFTEIELLRVVNFLILVLALWCCDRLMLQVNRELETERTEEWQPLPLIAANAIGYSMFLVAALIWVRVRLLSPDLLMLCFVLLAMTILLWIRRNPESPFHAKHILLGCTAGLGYLCKSWFFTFSPVLFGLALLVSGPWKKAVPRVAVGLVAMFLVMAPLVGTLSYRMGRLSTGELGKQAYAIWVSGEGEPIHPPRVLAEKPTVNLYEYFLPCTDPSGFDICYWRIGIEPKLDIKTHLKVIAGNLAAIVDQSPWLVLILLWFIWQWRVGAFKPGSIRPASTAVIFAATAAAGIGLFCLLHVETRYVAPFLFLSVLAMIAGLRYPTDDSGKLSHAMVGALLLTLLFTGLLCHTLVDQSVSGLKGSPSKASFRTSFQELANVASQLRELGIKNGDRVAMIGTPPPYWARMARARLAVQIPDPDEFLNAGKERRAQVADRLETSGIKAAVAEHPGFAKLKAEGWQRVGNTRHFFVRMIKPGRAG